MPAVMAHGDDQAVYAYAREDYDWWQARLSRGLANGLIGENLATEGVDVNGAVIGERWRIGPRLVLQPTFGRIPCATFHLRMGEPRWVKTFARSNRPGAYLRVLEPGGVWAGDPVAVEDRPAHGVTIARAFRAYMTEPELLLELVEIDGLPYDLRETLAKRLLQRRKHVIEWPTVSSAVRAPGVVRRSGHPDQPPTVRARPLLGDRGAVPSHARFRTPSPFRLVPSPGRR
jgi:MOSC domain-containing protein YiiM